MTNYDQYRTERDPTSGPPTYRAIIMAKGGAVLNAIRLAANDDDEAMRLAKALVDGHAVELWDGLRFIEHFPPAI